MNSSTNVSLRKTTFDDPILADDLVQGKIIAFPTETVYGLGVRWDSFNAFRQLQIYKHRSPMKTFAIMVGRHFNFEKYFYINESIKNIIENLLPGPLTLLLRPKSNVPFQTHLYTDLVGVRVPAQEQLLDFLDSLPFPVQTTSANLSGEAPSSNPNEILSEQFIKDLDVVSHIVVDSRCLLGSGVPSTVADLSSDKPIIRREGAITLEEISKYYGGQKHSMNIAIGCDHGGKDAAVQLKDHLISKGHSVVLLCPDGKEAGDYPLYALPAARAVTRGIADKCILICTSGEGVMICANKVKGIRCAVGYDDEVTKSCVEHNHCNGISFGAGRMPVEDIIRRSDIFLGMDYDKANNTRHSRRVSQITSFEDKVFKENINEISLYDDIKEFPKSNPK